MPGTSHTMPLDKTISQGGTSVCAEIFDRVKAIFTMEERDILFATAKRSPFA